jgi:hypothetical protein
MKHVIERFLKMTTKEVFQVFGELPNAQIFKDFIWIPGTKDPRLLLVGHADTVFTSSPRGIEWLGNLAKAGSTYTLVPGPAIPPKTPDPIVEATKETKKKKQKKTVPLKDLIKDFGLDTAGNPRIKVGDEWLTPDEYRELWAAERNEVLVEKEENTRGSYRHGNNYGHHQGNYNQGMGADDRVGIAMLWLLRNSGHSILITDGEEKGCVGARAAANTIPEELAKHQFAVEIDRQHDSEMVFYDVSTKEFEAYMKKVSGFRIDFGSSTDIIPVCNAAGICGVNLAAGYWGQHTSSEMFCYDAWLRTYKVVRKLCYEMTPERFTLPVRETKTAAPTKKLGPAASDPSTAPTGNPTAGTGGASTKKRKNSRVGATEGDIDFRRQWYKDGPRSLDTNVKLPSTALITTRIDPNTREKTTTREEEKSDQLETFPESQPLAKVVAAEAARAIAHTEAAIVAEDGSVPEIEDAIPPSVQKHADVSILDLHMLTVA